MPKPRKGESKSEYVQRAIPIFRQEGFSTNAAVGRAYGFYRTYGKGRKK